jgi:putative acetyltransferase
MIENTDGLPSAPTSLALDIRSERLDDRAAIRALVDAAFGPDDDTADFVESVREQADVCLAEVATAAGTIVGHAQWCDAPLVIDGRRVPSAYLACLSAEPSLQGRGIGSQLVRSGLARLTLNGYAAATLLGDPAYYGRFGFSPELAERIEAPHRSRGRGFQAVELVAGALAGTRIIGNFPAVIAPTEPPAEAAPSAAAATACSASASAAARRALPSACCWRA